MSRLQEDARKELPKTGEPHADVLKTGRAQIASTGSRARRQERAPKERQLGMDVRIQPPRTVMLRTMSFVMTPHSSLRTDEQEVRSGAAGPATV